ncbi:uncharacterized protein PITG_20045 [Phytophthora infestans T30-4]|uniref:Uncharacterized protein n=1 Tax=Phytophthora infestans (strain T30-4) TaxID=403677 RepID=D0P146_PHYIT|nr:uncharacterized protein PITG_20045 [Phytophthora infestans T30-4]EEY53761.1 hypothetical protein PITG_20045 [Phytophthora infestans T30-4]|eukprot:XP_002895985.1 hypothetical protein PITG_20045 [Phytophthora infestans T30-4]
MALHILDAAERLHEEDEGDDLASIFTYDRIGNNGLHLADIRDFLDVYDFALRKYTAVHEGK